LKANKRLIISEIKVSFYRKKFDFQESEKQIGRFSGEDVERVVSLILRFFG
jgi:hypothetical protein